MQLLQIARTVEKVFALAGIRTAICNGANGLNGLNGAPGATGATGPQGAAGTGGTGGGGGFTYAQGEMNCWCMRYLYCN